MAMRQLELLLVCPGCAQSFSTSTRVPMQLYCGHTICSVCLPSLPRDHDGHVSCPQDRIVDLRDVEDICESHHIMDTIEKVELCCVNNFNDAAEWYCPGTLEAVCERCKTQGKQWLSVKGVDLGQLYASQISALIANPQTRAQALRSNPNLEKRVRQMPSLNPRARETLYFSILGRPIPTLPKARDIVSKVDENGWVIVKRFHNIIPEKYCSSFDQIRRWTLTQNASQVEALTLRPSATIRLRALLLCKECGTYRNGSIEAVFLTEGAETTNPTTVSLSARVQYSQRNKQTEKLVLSRAVELRGGKEYTIKVKYAGQYLYFGDPSRRLEALSCPDGVSFKISDPKFTNGDFQNGQGSLAGPIVGWFYEPTGPIS